jgi:hypothetical protein
MWAAQAKTPLSPFFYVPFFLLWFSFMSSFLTFYCHIAPKVLKRWADERGYKLVSQRQPWLIKRASVGASSVQSVYEIVIIDRSGKTRSGLIKLGSYWWPRFSSANCPIEVYWDDGRDDDDWSNS